MAFKVNLITVPTREKKIIVKHPVEDIAKKTKMIIPQGYDVVLIDGDQLEHYTSGEHVFKQKRIAPLELFFVNKVIEVNVSFSTEELGLYIFDSQMKMPVEVCADGMIAFRVDDGEKLISQFPDVSSVNGKKLFEMFKSVIYMEMKIELVEMLKPDDVNIFNAYPLLPALSQCLHDKISALYEPLGISVSRFLITSIRPTDKLKAAMDEAYCDVQRQAIKDAYFAEKEKESMAVYEQKARIYKDSGYCGLTEAERDSEAERAIKIAEVGMIDSVESSPVPVSPIQPQTLANNTIYRAPEAAGAGSLTCDVCGECLTAEDTVCPICGVPTKEA